MTKEIYTVEITQAIVKDILPDVKVKVGKTIITGKVRGRLNKFATVYINEDSHEFSWQTIVNALNNDRPLLI